MEPDAALTAALASPAPTCAVHAAGASAQLPWPAQRRRMLQDGPCWDTKSVSLLKPAAGDPGRHGDTRHRRPAPCEELGALTPRPPTSLSADRGGIELSARPRRRWALPGSPQDGLFCRIRPAAAPRIKCLRRESHAVACGVAAMPVEPVRNLLPFAPSLGMQQPRHVSAGFCFVSVCLVGRREGNRCQGPRAALRSLLSVSPLWGPQRGDARRHCRFAGRVPRRGRVLCCRSVVVPVNHSLLNCPARVLCFGVGFLGLCLPSSPGAPQLAWSIAWLSKKTLKKNPILI